MRSLTHLTLTASIALAALDCTGPDRATPGPSSEDRTSQTAIGANHSCDADCLEIWTAGVKWLIDEQGYSPSGIVLDTAKSGVQVHGEGPGLRLVSMSDLGRLVAVSGIGKGSEAELVDCVRAAGVRSCRLRRGQVLVTLQVPQRNLDKPAEAYLVLTHRGSRLVPEVGDTRYEIKGYKLSLVKGSQGWRVVNARLIDQT